MRDKINQLGTVYIIHLHTSLAHARHYVGFATKVNKRLAHHRHNTGSNMLRVCNERGISYTLVVQFAGTRADERRLKNTNNTARYCPCCTVKPKQFRSRILPHEKTYKFCEL